MLLTPLPLRSCLLLLGLIMVLGACGRRGPLEPPLDPSAPKQQVQIQPSSSRQTVSTEGDEDADNVPPEAPAVTVAPSVATQPQKRSRDFVVPKKPFILDSLL